jgi:hypothetical protein
MAHGIGKLLRVRPPSLKHRGVSDHPEAARRASCAIYLAVGLAALAPCASGAIDECQRAKLAPDDCAPVDRFGFSLDISGTIALVGVPFDDDHGSNSGSAYVFSRLGSGWTLTAKLTRENGGEGDGFGRSVAIDGQLMVIGVLGEALACVFEKLGGDWLQVTELTADDGWLGDFFGQSVALSGADAVVGAPQDNDNGGSSGSAYVYRRDPNGVWSQAAKLVAEDGDGGDVFGDAVAISDDVIVIGAQDDEAQGNWSGSAYVFEHDVSGTWSQTAKLLADDGSTFWNFGTSVAISGDTALIGADNAHGAEPYTGAAYVFERDPNGLWQQTAKLVARDGANSDRFGSAVAVSADIAVVGAWGDDDYGIHSGAVYVFTRQPDASWTQVAKLLPADGAEDDRFGSAAAVDGNTAIIGAYCDDDHGEDSGSAYVFAVGPDEDGDGIMDVCLCPGDLDHDLDVDLSDLAQLLSNYGTTSGMTYEDGDLDEDGGVDLADLAALLAEYGTVCP